MTATLAPAIATPAPAPVRRRRKPVAANIGALAGHIDITTPACGLFARHDEATKCPDVVLINGNASASQLLGFAHGRCRELAMFAFLASTSDAGESDLRQCAEHLWNGLETLLTVLDCMDARIGGAA